MDPSFSLGSSNQFRSSDCLPVGDGRSGTLAGASSGDRPCLANDLRVCGCFGAAAAPVGLVWQAGRFRGIAPLLRDVWCDASWRRYTLSCWRQTAPGIPIRKTYIQHHNAYPRRLHGSHLPRAPSLRCTGQLPRCRFHPVHPGQAM